MPEVRRFQRFRQTLRSARCKKIIFSVIDPSAARIAVLVGAGRVEVGGPWPHSPLADEWLPLGSQSLSVVAALRSAGGLLRRGSGQLKVGLLVLGLAREQP